MHICFIEDTPLHGGTQIWVSEATRSFLAKGHQVTVLAPHDTWMVGEVGDTQARVVTYDWQGVVGQGEDDLRMLSHRSYAPVSAVSAPACSCERCLSARMLL